MFLRSIEDIRKDIPDPMPSDQAVVKASKTLEAPMLIAGSRGDAPSRKPDYTIHGEYDVRGAIWPPLKANIS